MKSAARWVRSRAGAVGRKLAELWRERGESIERRRPREYGGGGIDAGGLF